MGKGIPFTQHLRPDGRKISITFTPDEEVTLLKADGLIRQGCYFEAEVLTNGLVSLTVSYEGQDFGIKVVPNNDKTVAAVVALVNEAYINFPPKVPPMEG